jgi:membrane protein
VPEEPGSEAVSKAAALAQEPSRRARPFLAFWYRVLRDAAQLWLERNAFTYAGALAFYTLFSLAPVVIITLTIIGLVLGEAAAQGQVVAHLEGTLGEEAAAAIESAVSQTRIEAAGWWPTLLGVLAMLVGATTVFAQMQYSLNAIWGVVAKPSRSGVVIFIRNRLLSLTVVVAIGFVLLVSLLAGVALQAMVHYASDWIPVPGRLLASLEFLLALAVITLLFATIFKVLPDVVLAWDDVLAGAAVTAVLFGIGRYGIAAYLAYSAPASTYGAAGSLVLLLLWVYYSSLILLFGAAFTRVLLLARGRPLVPRNRAVEVQTRIVEIPNRA